MLLNTAITLIFYTVLKITECIEHEHSHLFTKSSLQVQPNLYVCITSFLFSLLTALALHVLSSSLRITDRSFDMLHLVSATSSLLLSVNLVPVFLSVTDLFLHLADYLPLLSHHYHHQLPHSFILGFKPTSFTNPSQHRLSSSFRTDSSHFHPDCIFWGNIGFCFSFFSYSFGSMRWIKLASNHLSGARKYSIVISYPVMISWMNRMHLDVVWMWCQIPLWKLCSSRLLLW